MEVYTVTRIDRNGFRDTFCVMLNRESAELLVTDLNKEKASWETFSIKCHYIEVAEKGKGGIEYRSATADDIQELL